jgi:hypothetical protein
MKLKEIYENFDVNGIFPSDAEMIEAIQDNPNYVSIYDLEIEMIYKAMDDENHPYHSKVIPIDSIDLPLNN